MQFNKYKATIFSWLMLKNLIANFFYVFGVLAMLLGVVDIFWPQKLNSGKAGLFYLATASLVVAIVKSIPKLSASHQFSSPEFSIKVVVGDLFTGKDNIVVGMSDTFDTEIGDIISKNSIQGQFLEKVYNSDKAKLDSDLSTELVKLGLSPQLDSAKTRGKNQRYELGTTACLKYGNAKYFCCAYSRMGDDLVAKSTFNGLWISLGNLWESVRINGQKNKITMPIVGSDLARISEANRSLLIKAIILSFVVNSKSLPISNELEIVVHQSNAHLVNFIDIQNFLSNLN